MRAQNAKMNMRDGRRKPPVLSRREDGAEKIVGAHLTQVRPLQTKCCHSEGRNVRGIPAVNVGAFPTDSLDSSLLCGPLNDSVGYEGRNHGGRRGHRTLHIQCVIPKDGTSEESRPSTQELFRRTSGILRPCGPLNDSVGYEGRGLLTPHPPLRGTFPSRGRLTGDGAPLQSPSPAAHRRPIQSAKHRSSSLFTFSFSLFIIPPPSPVSPAFACLSGEKGI